MTEVAGSIVEWNATNIKIHKKNIDMIACAHQVSLCEFFMSPPNKQNLAFCLTGKRVGLQPKRRVAFGLRIQCVQFG